MYSKTGWQRFISSHSARQKYTRRSGRSNWHSSAVSLDWREHYGDTAAELRMQRGSILHFICIDVDSWVHGGGGEDLTDFLPMWIHVYFFSTREKKTKNRPSHCACLKNPVILQPSCRLWRVRATINTVWLKKHTRESPQTKLNLPRRQ